MGGIQYHVGRLVASVNRDPRISSPARRHRETTAGCKMTRRHLDIREMGGLWDVRLAWKKGLKPTLHTSVGSNTALSHEMVPSSAYKITTAPEPDLTRQRMPWALAT